MFECWVKQFRFLAHFLFLQQPPILSHIPDLQIPGKRQKILNTITFVLTRLCLKLEVCGAVYPRSNWNWKSWFCEGGKSENPVKNPRENTKTNNKLNPHMMPDLGFDPGQHWWEASALITDPPLRHPCSPVVNYFLFISRRSCRAISTT